MLNGQEIQESQYPELFKSLGQAGAKTLQLYNYGQGEGGDGCTIRHVKQGSGRALNSYEGDELKGHLHSMKHGHGSQPHSHWLSRLLGGISRIVSYASSLEASGVFNVTWNRRTNGDGYGGPGDPMWYNDITIKPIESDASTVAINDFNGNTANTGGSETRMKNMAVQCYIVAKVVI